MGMRPEDLINQSLQLVSPPATYGKINALLNHPHSSADDISSVIATDPTLTARLLKVVNSPFYGFPSQIETISRAITIIGSQELSNLALATSVIESFKGIPAELIDMNTFWRNSLACALIAKKIADYAGQSPSERLFIAGLLHNIGALVLYQSVPELATKALQQSIKNDEDILITERRVIGFNHTDAGLALIKAWLLPPLFESVIRDYRRPQQAQNFSIEVAIIHIADIIVRSDDPMADIDPDISASLNLNQQRVDELLQQITDQLDDLSSVMTS
ncbi:MAG: phosphohydrolase [Gammaproteobacteria bacterium]|nr:MAG: phosphohydrolase [Gammaproteobacteria bacterium]